MKHAQSLSFNHLFRVVGVAALLLGVAACSGGSHWTRPGVTESQRDADYAACRSEARELTGAGLDADMTASRQSVNHGYYEDSGGPADLYASHAASGTLVTCMTDKGYSGY